MREWTVGPVLLAAVLGVLACAGERPGEETPPSTSESRAALGRAWFENYCAACHGLSARGDGPVATQLTTPPADLTRIAARRGGRFDRATVAAFIDGRERLLAHGSPEMPVWGRALDDRRSGGFADETLLGPGSIFLIVEYLESIQVQAP